jgi:hypothetical protein
VDREILGQMAVQLLLGRINDPERLVIRTIVGVVLVERESVCPPRAHDIGSNPRFQTPNPKSVSAV